MVMASWSGMEGSGQVKAKQACHWASKGSPLTSPVMDRQDRLMVPGKKRKLHNKPCPRGQDRHSTARIRLFQKRCYILGYDYELELRDRSKRVPEQKAQDSRETSGARQHAASCLVANMRDNTGKRLRADYYNLEATMLGTTLQETAVIRQAPTTSCSCLQSRQAL